MRTGTLRSLKAVVMKQPKVSAAITLSEKAKSELARDSTVFISPLGPAGAAAAARAGRARGRGRKRAAAGKGRARDRRGVGVTAEGWAWPHGSPPSRGGHAPCPPCPASARSWAGPGPASVRARYGGGVAAGAAGWVCRLPAAPCALRALLRTGESGSAALLDICIRIVKCK